MKMHCQLLHRLNNFRRHPHNALTVPVANQLVSMNATTETIMKTNLPSLVRAALLLALGFTTTLRAADARTDSWFTTYSAKYARLYTTDANKTSGTSVTTWSNGTQTQSLPAYAGVQEIYSSASWVYIRSTGLGSHIMGPWQNGTFPNLPKNQKVFYRIPRTPAVPATKTLTALGAIGYFVDGVSMFDSRDGFYWNGSTEAGGGGTGYWNREAYVNEGATFDPGYAHQEQSGTYHYHANPIALRYLLGDHVDYVAATKTYAESTNAVAKHSPILGWVRDGYPVYGPYGYSVSNNAVSGVRRMLSGFQLRNGSRGTDNLTTAGRSTIPQWAVRAYNVASAQSGPAVSTTYPLGRYMEDNAFLGDLGSTLGTDYDLDEYNGRFCVTPEFPGGTYAYFVSISSNGTPVYPYNIGRSFYGTPIGAAVTTLAETVTTNFVGGASAPQTFSKPTVGGGNVTLTWSATEGGTYRVECTTNFTTWTTNATNLTATGGTGRYTNSSAAGLGFYKIARTALAAYDPVSGTSGGNSIVSVSPTSGNRGTTFTLTITLPNTAPPQMAPINSVTVGTITGTSNVHVSQTQVTSVITLPAGAATGPQTVTIIFPGAPPNPQIVETYTLVNGFTIN